jgi:hypothetical protein
MLLTHQAAYKSVIIYSGLIIICLFTYFIGPVLADLGKQVRIFGIDSLVLVVTGLLGVYLAPRTGFPSLADSRISGWQRYWLPLFTGIGFGIVDVAFFKVFIHPEPLTALTPSMQPFPYSLLLYTSGALETEAIHRLIPIPLLMWLIGGFMLKDARSAKLFWVLAVLTSLVEPYMQMITGSVGLMIFSFLSGFIFNFIQALCFRWYGFLACLFVRLGHYLVWHILFGIITEFV